MSVARSLADLPPGNNFSVTDTTTGQSTTTAGESYAGPVAGLGNEIIFLTPDNLNITANVPNVFIHSDRGQDALQALSGTNVLDGGTNSNFLTGGTGTDTFFVDARGASADIWSTLNNFHARDSATVWGITRQDFNILWQDGQGAPGYTGLTLHVTAPGKPTASLTIPGYTTADLNNGRLSVSFGTEPISGSSYMYVHANS
ncbi:MAG: hypothetical protein JOY71_11250 [Acetobacteraceae bacterium]|nr:hypothetical protein [Acetobacteraceae bacterium]